MAETEPLWAEFSLAPVTRSQVALFAGGSGDHNPIHIDIDAARAAGFDDVFGQGMLSMALLGRLLTGKADLRQIRSFGARFEAPCQIGDALRLRAVVSERFTEMGERRIRLKLSADAAGRTIVSGEAVLAEGGVDE